MTHPKIHDRIEKKLDVLEDLLKRQAHLKLGYYRPMTIRKTLMEFSKYRSYMNDEQSDFVDCARHAIEEHIEWK